MGVNISLHHLIERDSAGHMKYVSDHQGWDSSRRGGDREMPKFVGDLPHEIRFAAADPWIDDALWIRPTDFEAWRSAVTHAPDPDRFKEMLGFLEQNPDLWIHFGY